MLRQPASLYRLLVQGQPPSLHRLLVQVLKFCQPEMSLHSRTSPFPVYDLLSWPVNLTVRQRLMENRLHHLVFTSRMNYQKISDQDLSEDANYRETIRGVRSFMGWHQIPDYDSTSSSLDDNPFAGSRAKPTGKVSVKLPVDEWLCRKFERLNVTVAEGYPSRNSETGGLLRDQFVKTPRSSKWYAMHSGKKDSACTTVCDWSPEPAKLNSSFTRVARRSLPSAPASRTFSQDTLRR